MAKVSRSDVHLNLGSAIAGILSVLAVVMSAWSAYEAREARLDVRRSQLRLEMQDVVDDFRRAVVIMKCYVETARLNVDSMQSSIRNVETAIGHLNRRMEESSGFGSSELDQEQVRLNSKRSEINAALRESLIGIRKPMPAQTMERVDKVCHQTSKDW